MEAKLNMESLTKRTVLAKATGSLACTTCGIEKPLSDFYFRPNGNIRSRCKACEMAAQKVYRDAHSSEMVARMKKWEAEHPERAKELKRNAVQRRLARKRGLPHTFTTAEWAECLEYFDHRCAYCGTKTDDLTREHVIPLSKGGPYTKGNIIPACGVCNSRKFNTDIWEWYRAQEFYTAEREQKIREYLSNSAR